MIKEKRTCPFCGNEYVRIIYPTDRGRGSICKKCHKRSDKSSFGIRRWTAPKEKQCANAGCSNTFYSNGSQKYCLVCMDIVHTRQTREAVRRFRLKHNGERTVSDIWKETYGKE
jgi:hypothetical protein